MKNSLQSVSATAFALLLVLSTALGGVAMTSQPVAATHDCDGVDNFLASYSAGAEWVLNVGDVSGDSYKYDECGRNHDSQVIIDMQESDAEQEHIDYYTGAAGSQENGEATYKTRRNALSESDTVVWGRAQAAALEAYQNGEGQVGMEAAAREVIEDYYARQQHQTLENAELHMTELEYYRNRSAMEDNMTPDTIYASGTYENGTFTADSDGQDFQSSDIQNQLNVTYTLANGGTHKIPVFVTADERSGGTYDMIWTPAGTEYIDTNELDAESGAGSTPAVDYRSPGNGVIGAVAPTDNYDDVVAYDASMYAENYETAQTQNDQLQSNVGPWVDGIHPKLEDGTVSPSEAIPALTKIDQYSNASADGNGYIYTTATLASMGFDTPDLNSTGQMTIEYQGNEYQGFLLAQNSPEGGWEVGQTYNTADFNGSEMLVTVDGSDMRLDDGTQFTLTGATDMDGDSVNTVSTETYNYKTYDADDFSRLVDQMSVLADEVEQREPEAGGGGGGSGGGMPDVSPLQAGAVVAVLLGAIWIANRSKDDEPPYRGRR